MDRPNSINQKFSNINKCDICFNNYDRSNKQPVIICSMHHTICRECMVSLENKPNCPFCRQRIKFDKVVVNNYIFQLLPQQEIKPNTRSEVAQVQPLSSYPAQANRFTANQPSRSLYVNQSNQFGQNMNRQFSVPNLNNQVIRANPPPSALPPPAPAPTSINNRALQRVYEQDFHNDHEIQWEDGSHSQQVTLYKVLYFLQIPFTFFNLYFALASPTSECMDKPHRLTILIVRPWLMSIGITQVSLMLLFLLIIFLVHKRIIQTNTFQKLRFLIGALFVVKILVWMFAQIQLFSACVVRYCSGGLYAYFVVLTILHGLVILGICCLANRSN